MGRELRSAAPRTSLIERFGWKELRRAGGKPREDPRLAAAVAFWLYATGATLILVTLALPSHPAQNEVGLLVLAGVAYAVAAALVIAFDRLPRASFEAAAALGTLVVALAIHFSADAAAPFLLFYFWIVLFASYFFERRAAAFQLALVGVAYGVVLTASPEEHLGPVYWLMGFSSLAVTAVLASLATDRLNRVWEREREREQALVRTLAERERAQEKLGEAEARYRALVEQLPLVVYIDAIDEDSSAIYMSPQIESLLGYTPEEWQKDPKLFRRLLHPDDRERVMEEVVTGDLEKRWSSEYRLVARDGRVVWFHDEAVTVRDNCGRPLYCQGFMLDITERKQAEETRLRLASIVESSDDAIFSADLDGLIESWNLGAERIYGYEAGEVVGRHVSILIPADRPHEAPDILRKIRSGESVVHLETVRVTKTGTPIDVSVTVSPVVDASGRVSGASAIQRVITDRKRAEAERERLLAAEKAARREAEAARRTLADQNERLRELDRLKDEFVALVSHELRTPLTSIRGYLALMLAGRVGELRPRHRQFLEVVDHNSERLLRLVSGLLFFAQAGAGKLALDPSEVAVDELASESVEAAKPIADEKRIDLALATEAVPTVRADRARLGQLLDNLLSNALKFTPSGGRVEVGAFAANGHVVLSVSDSGVGIPATEQGRVFERFFRSSLSNEEAVPGTGLGLAIAKAIADAHGGEITFESEEGKGTTFRVRLPVRSSEGDGAASAEAGG